MISFFFIGFLWLQLAQKRRPKVASGSGKDAAFPYSDKGCQRRNLSASEANCQSSIVVRTGENSQQTHTHKNTASNLHGIPPTVLRRKIMAVGESAELIKNDSNCTALVGCGASVRSLAYWMHTNNRVELAVEDKSNCKLFFPDLLRFGNGVEIEFMIVFCREMNLFQFFFWRIMNMPSSSHRFL